MDTADRLEKSSGEPPWDFGGTHFTDECKDGKKKKKLTCVLPLGSA